MQEKKHTGTSAKLLPRVKVPKKGLPFFPSPRSSICQRRKRKGGRRRWKKRRGRKRWRNREVIAENELERGKEKRISRRFVFSSFLIRSRKRNDLFDAPPPPLTTRSAVFRIALLSPATNEKFLLTPVLPGNSFSLSNVLSSFTHSRLLCMEEYSFAWRTTR